MQTSRISHDSYPPPPPPPPKPAEPDLGKVVARAVVRGLAFAAVTAVAGPVFGAVAAMAIGGDDGDCSGCAGA